VRCRLASSLGAIVAGGAGARHGAVVEVYGTPQRCAVTGRTFLIGGDVIGRLAGSLRPVVAGLAGTAHAVVIEADVGPVLGVVAALALVLRGDVVGGLASRAHVIVAARAVARRGLEHAARMAGFAAYGSVGAGQRKPVLK